MLKTVAAWTRVIHIVNERNVPSGGHVPCIGMATRADASSMALISFFISFYSSILFYFIYLFILIRT